MTTDLRQRLETAVSATERHLTAAQDLLRMIQAEAEQFAEVVARHERLVGCLQSSVEAGRAVLTRATGLGHNAAMTLAAQVVHAAPVVEELLHAVATAEQQDEHERAAAAPAAIAPATTTAPVEAPPAAEVPAAPQATTPAAAVTAVKSEEGSHP